MQDNRDRQSEPDEISKPSKAEKDAARKLDKRLRHECLRCPEQALADSDFCQVHRDDNRKRARAAAKKRRKDRRKARVCVDCGLPSKRFRCSRCLGRQNTKRDRVRSPISGLANAGFTKTETGPAFRGGGTYQTQRYVGHSRRGRLTLQEQAMEWLRDLDFVDAETQKAREFIADYIALPLKDMPRIQREAKRREALVFLGNARRFLEGLEDQFGG